MTPLPRITSREILLGETDRIPQTNTQRAGSLGGQAGVVGIVGTATGEPWIGAAAGLAAGMIGKWARDLREERHKAGSNGGFFNGLLAFLSLLG